MPRVRNGLGTSPLSGVVVECRPQGLFFHQRKYAIDILELADISDRKPCSTLVDTQDKVSDDDDAYRRHNDLPEPCRGSIVPHLHLTRHCLRGPTVCLHMHTSWEPHRTTAKWSRTLACLLTQLLVAALAGDCASASSCSVIGDRTRVPGGCRLYKI